MLKLWNTSVSKIPHLKLDSGLGYYVQASKPKFQPENIGNWPLSSVFLPVPPPSSLSSFFIPLVGIFFPSSGKYFFPTSGMNSLSHWWEFDFFPLVGKKSFPLVRIPRILAGAVRLKTVKKRKQVLLMAKTKKSEL